MRRRTFWVVAADRELRSPFVVTAEQAAMALQRRGLDVREVWDGECGAANGARLVWRAAS